MQQPQAFDLSKSNNPRRFTSPISFSSVSPSPAPEFLLLLSSFTLHLSSFLSLPLRRLDRRPALPSPPFPPLPAPHPSPQKSNLNPKSMSECLGFVVWDSILLLEFKVTRRIGVLFQNPFSKLTRFSKLRMKSSRKPPLVSFLSQI
ncbi:hypothetical protein Droror1_Dr00025073 [Drosera rotundifolia]